MHRRRRATSHARPELAPPVELRFIDLFMLLVAAMIFLVLGLSNLEFFQGEPSRSTPPRLVTASLPAAVQGTHYDVYLAVAGGQPPYRFRLLRGRLPSGLRLDGAEGRALGQPDVAETVRFVIEVNDGKGRSDSRELELVALPTSAPQPLRVSGAKIVLPAATTFRRYSEQIPVEGGTWPYRFTHEQGQLPPGLTLASNGVIQGEVALSPFDRGAGHTWNFLASVRDRKGRTAHQEVSLDVQYRAAAGDWDATLDNLARASSLMLRYVLAPLFAVVLIALVLLALYGSRGVTTNAWPGVPGLVSHWWRSHRRTGGADAGS